MKENKVYKISKDQVIYAMSAEYAPVLSVDPKSQIEFETCDALSGQITSETDQFAALDWNRINPATGPVYINGAEPGDTLAVTIEQIKTADVGVTITGPNMGVLGDVLKENAIKVIPIEGEEAIFSESIRLPLNKMVGVIGTAPKEGAISCGVPDFHGGNMDCKEVREGATVYLPVNVPGALLALGDIHAVMADGEICVSGVEVSGSVRVRVNVIKGERYPLPMITTATHVMTLASHEDLDEAADMAVRNMVSYLCETVGFQADKAAMLLSLVGDVRICQIVDPKKTVRVELEKKYMKTK